MMQGTIKWYDTVKGYGFIVSEGGNDIFVHHTGLNKETGMKNLKEGQIVQFEITEGKRGPQATNIKIIQK